jgi:transposase
MKRDGRKLDHQTLETIRFMAVERVREGEAPSAVIASYGFCRTTIYKWLGVASKPGVGVRGLASRFAPGRPRRLTARQEQQVFRWINGNDPRQYGLDFGLWTRKVVADLIERKFAIRLGLTAVGELFANLNLTPKNRCNGRINAIQRRLRNGDAKPIQPLLAKRRLKAERCFSGMSRVFAPTPCMDGPGGLKAKRPLSNALANGKRSALLQR